LPKSAGLWSEIKKYKIAYLWISPFYILFAVFGIYPIFYSFVLSAFRWPGIGAWKFIGIENFVLLFKDELFWKVLGNTIFLLLAIIPLRTFLALVLAVVFNSPGVRGKQFFRAVYILPFVTSMILISIIFRVLLEYHGGWVNVSLGVLGIPPVNWLRDVGWTKISLSLVIGWRTLGYFMIIMLAGLQRISPELYEAARIDGAGTVQSFLRITVPLMRPIILFVLIISTIGVFQTFEEAFVLTQGGPRYSSTTMTYLLWLQAFQYSRLGYASSVALVLFFFIVLASVVQLRFFREQE
jgi:ABC-type sugar transport system permease subunit